GAESRLKVPHRLRNGDRFVIGQYVIATTLEEEAAEPGDAAPAPAPPREDDLWNAGPDVADPIDPRQLRDPRDAAPVRADFLDWAVDVPMPVAGPAARAAAVSYARDRPAAPDLEQDGWAAGASPEPAPQPEIIPVPMPRRPGAGEVRRPRAVAESD